MTTTVRLICALCVLWGTVAVPTAWGHTPEEKSFYLQSRIVLRLNPGDATAGNAVGVWHLEYGELAASREAFATVLEHHPDNALARTGLALLDEHEGKPEAALRRIRAVKHHPSAFAPFLALVRGRLLVRLERPAEAEPVLRDALERERNPHALYLWLGRAVEAQGRSDAAEPLYRKAIEADPYWPEPYSRLSLLYMERGEAERARKILQQVAVLENPSPYPNTDIGVLWAWVMRGEREE